MKYKLRAEELEKNTAGKEWKSEGVKWCGNIKTKEGKLDSFIERVGELKRKKNGITWIEDRVNGKRDRRHQNITLIAASEIAKVYDRNERWNYKAEQKATIKINRV